MHIFANFGTNIRNGNCKRIAFMYDYKAIVFDLDGTLYSSKPLKWRVALKAVLSGKLRFLLAERKARKELAGKNLGNKDEAYGVLFERMAPIAKTTPEAAGTWFFEWYMPLQVKILKKNCRCREGLHERLAQLGQSGVKTAVLSDYGFVEEKLDALGLSASEFDMVFESMEFGGLKPYEECFRGVCDRLGVLPEDALMVGDREETDGGAVRIGMKYEKTK